MARFTGPRSKVSRRFNEPIFGASKALAKKAYGPGQHGRGRRKKQSEYAVQLMEKQKAKYTYGVLEKQFRNLFKKAAAKGGVTGDNLLQLLEARLDNTVFRLGIASTRRAARQLVSHGHITVNGSGVNVPSYSLKPGDVISVKSKSQTVIAILDSVSSSTVASYSWLEFDSKDLTGKYLSVPERTEIPENIKEQLIVELYSK
jgi:small subunit ribosomal protein S4